LGWDELKRNKESRHVRGKLESEKFYRAEKEMRLESLKATFLEML